MVCINPLFHAAYLFNLQHHATYLFNLQHHATYLFNLYHQVIISVFAIFFLLLFHFCLFSGDCLSYHCLLNSYLFFLSSGDKPYIYFCYFPLLLLYLRNNRLTLFFIYFFIWYNFYIVFRIICHVYILYTKKIIMYHDKKIQKKRQS